MRWCFLLILPLLVAPGPGRAEGPSAMPALGVVPTARLPAGTVVTASALDDGMSGHLAGAVMLEGRFALAARQSFDWREDRQEPGIDARLHLSGDAGKAPALALGLQGLGPGDRLDRQYLVIEQAYRGLTLAAGLVTGTFDHGWSAFGRRFDGFAGIDWPVLPARDIAVMADYDGGLLGAPAGSLWLRWRPLPTLSLAAGLRGGDRLALRLGWRFSDSTPPSAKPRIEPVRLRPRPAGLPDPARHDRVRVTLDPAIPAARSIGRAARAAMLRNDPALVTVEADHRGLRGPRMQVPRPAFAAADAGLASLDELWQQARIDPVGGAPPLWQPGLDWRLIMRARLSLAEPEIPIVGQFSGDLRLRVDLAPGLELGGEARVQLAENLTAAFATRPLAARPVRSDADFYAGSPESINRAWVAWQGGAASGLSGRLEAGWLEPLHAGVGGQMRYAPAHARLAVSVDLHQVWKREPQSLLLRRGTGRLSGGVTLHYFPDDRDLSYGLYAGRFLGGDWGGALSFHRRFDVGVGLDATATLSEGLSGRSDIAGERFLVGLRLRVPLGELALGLTHWLDIDLAPIGRDAGQRLQPPENLAELAETASFRRLWRDRGSFLD